MKLFSTYRGLPKSVYIIFIAQIVNRFGDFVMPFLTLFLTQELGFSIAKTGTVVMASTLMTIPGSLLGGKVADGIGRKKAYLFFQASAGIALFICAFLYKTPWMILFVMASSFFNGAVRPIISAILADVLPTEQRQAGFSLSYLGINIGVALGPIVAGFLYNHFLILLFIGDALTSFLAVGLVGLFIQETMPLKAKSSTDKASTIGKSTDGTSATDASTAETTDVEIKDVPDAEKHETGNVFTVMRKRPQLLLFLAFSTLYGATYVQAGFALPLTLNHYFGEKGPQLFGSLLSMNAVTVLVMTAGITAFSKRFRPIVNIALGGIAYVVGFGMIGLITKLPLFWISTVLWTLGEIIISINYGVYITSQTPQNFRARLSAVMNLSWALGAIIGTALMGVFIDQFGLINSWGVAGLLALGGTVGMFSLSKHKSEDKKVN